MKIDFEEMQSNWCVVAKLMWPVIWVAEIYKPEFIQSPYFKSYKEASDWLMENHGVKPWEPSKK